MVKVLRAYTDGSCLNQKFVNDPSRPRYAGIGVFFADNSELNVSEVFEFTNPTNIRAEFFAAHTAMQIMKQHYDMQIANGKTPPIYKIYIDCKLVIDTFFGSSGKRSYINGWKPKNWKPKDTTPWQKRDGSEPKNLDLIIPMYELFIQFPEGQLQFVKVKAHRPKAPTEPKEYTHWYGNKQADILATSASDRDLRLGTSGP
jgi:ribonuclease HI